MTVANATNVSNYQYAEIDQMVIDTVCIEGDNLKCEDRLSLVEPSLRRELVLVDTLTTRRH